MGMVVNGWKCESGCVQLWKIGLVICYYHRDSRVVVLFLAEFSTPAAGQVWPNLLQLGIVRRYDDNDG